VNGGVYEMTAAIARKVRMLAASRILKLNMTPDSIVFCPLLVANSDTNELEPHGYGYQGMETVKGVPVMHDFDPVFTKRFGSASKEYDPDCAYVVMMLVLICTVRAQYGEAVTQVMVNKLTGRAIDGAALPEGELPEEFESISLASAGARARDRAAIERARVQKECERKEQQRTNKQADAQRAAQATLGGECVERRGTPASANAAVRRWHAAYKKVVERHRRAWREDRASRMATARARVESRKQEKVRERCAMERARAAEREAADVRAREQAILLAQRGHVSWPSPAPGASDVARERGHKHERVEERKRAIAMDKARAWRERRKQDAELAERARALEIGDRINRDDGVSTWTPSLI